MSERMPMGNRQALELEPLSQGRRAAYRRVLAVLKANGFPFVVAGAVGLAAHLGRFLDGDLEVYLGPDVAPAAIAAMSTAGFRMTVDEAKGQVLVDYAGYLIKVAWRLPHPLGGVVDDAWLQHAVKAHVLGLRIKVAPLEELLWIRVAVPGVASVSDPLVPELLRERGRTLDWSRLLVRLAGLEALFLAHVFLFHHLHPEAAKSTVPHHLIETLIGRLNGAASESVEQPIH
jgi:hypothetical protein